MRMIFVKTTRLSVFKKFILYIRNDYSVIKFDQL